MCDKQLWFTLWDVGHGISIWIRTPNDQNHWIDLGRTSKFSPSEYVSQIRPMYVDYLIISRPEKICLDSGILSGSPKAYTETRRYLKTTCLEISNMSIRKNLSISPENSPFQLGTRRVRQPRPKMVELGM